MFQICILGCKDDTAIPVLGPLASYFLISHYDLHFEIDADQSQFSSIQSVTILSTTTVQKMEFELHADLMLDVLSLERPDGTDIPIISWQEIGENTHQRGTGEDKFLRYSVEPSASILSGETVVLKLAYHIQSSAVGNSAERELLKFSISETGSRALHPVNGVFPYFGGLVAAPFDIELTYPVGQLSCVPGNLIATVTQSGQIIETYTTEVARIPVFYIGPGQMVVREQDGITVEYYLAEGQSLPEEVIDHTFGSARLFNERFGDPGTETYRIAFVDVPASSTTGESKGNAIYFAYRGNNEYSWDEQTILDFTQLVSHEIFHNWNIWYLQWQGSFYEWFVEGGAGFMAAWAAEQTLGVDAGSDGRLAFVEGFYNRQGYTASRTLENAQKGSDAENSLIYSYGALVWEQLRQKLGDAAFQSGLYDFYTQYGTHSADFPTLISALQDHTPVQVQAYLDQWVRHNAQIDLAIENVSIVQNGNLFETSVQVAILSDRDYEIYTALGYRTAMSGDVSIVEIHTTQDGMHEVAFSSSERPVSIILDPEHRVPQTELNNDVWSE